MTQSLLKHVRFAGVHASVPDQRFDNLNNPSSFTDEERRKFVDLTGVRERRIAPSSICSTDLCHDAARRLLAELDWPAETIDLLAFVTQTPDYFQPSNGALAHRDLGLPLDCASFDITLGCSGYPYGLSVAAHMVAAGTAKRALVLHGETPTKVNHPDDRATFLLFGDAGSATALEFDESAGTCGFNLHSDGTGYDDLIVPGRGFRVEQPENDRDRFLYMNGTNIFNFTLKRVPKLVRDGLALMEWQTGDVDRFVFHQANLFMLKHLMKKLKVPAERAPLTIESFGNTGGVSVPLTMARHYLEQPPGAAERLMLLGFGIGLSWGAAMFEIGPEVAFGFSELASG
ncbi:MAG: ketoacyl-ACP synthase III [Pseudomonadota bacterium]